MSVGIRRRSLLSAAVAGGVVLGLGRQAVAAGMSGAQDGGQNPMQPGAGNFTADADARAVLLRYGGELGGNKVGKHGRQP